MSSMFIAYWSPLRVLHHYIMRFILIVCLSLLYSHFSFASPHNDSLTNELNQAIRDAHIYDSIKLIRIAKLKNLLTEESLNSVDKQYDIITQIYEEYKYYNFDSALVYAKELQRLSSNKYNPSLIYDAKLKVVFVIFSGGM